MNQFLAVSFVWFASMALGIGIMMFGWGLHPASWQWIIVGGFAGRFLIGIIEHMIKVDGKKLKW